MGVGRSSVRLRSEAEPAKTRPGELHRILRIRDGLAVTVGIVIGAGILRTPGLIAGYLGNPLAILGMWFLGGIVVALSTLVLAEMATAILAVAACLLAHPELSVIEVNPLFAYENRAVSVNVAGYLREII